MTKVSIDTKEYRDLRNRFDKAVGHDEEVTVLFEEGRWDEAAEILRQIIDMQREDYEQTLKLANDFAQARKEWE